MVASGILLAMVFMTSTSIVSYARAYHQYTDKGLQVRQAAKTLEVVTQHLRSAQSIQTPERSLDCSTKPLLFQERAAGPRALWVTELGVLEVQEIDPDGHKKSSVKIGTVRGFSVQETSQGRQRQLHIKLEFEGGPPMETDISLRGVSQ
ncbi:unnamed protein product [Phaeothamnion confervicola]